MALAQLRDLISDFDFRENSFVPGGVSIQVALADPTRWAIMFAVPSTGQVATFTTNNPATGNLGFFVSATIGNFAMNFRDYGILPQQAWFAFAAINVHVSVFEVLYRPVGWEEAGPELMDELAARYARAGISQ